MNRRKLIIFGILIVTLLLFSLPNIEVSAQDMLWEGITAGSTPAWGCSTRTDTRSYHAQSFSVTASGAYTISVLAVSGFGGQNDQDAVLAIYAVYFNQFTPNTVDCLAFDDNGGDGVLPLMSIELTPGVVYVAVVHSNSEVATGALYIGQINGPGTVLLYPPDTWTGTTSGVAQVWGCQSGTGGLASLYRSYHVQRFTVPFPGAYSVSVLSGSGFGATNDAVLAIYEGNFDPINPNTGSCIAFDDNSGSGSWPTIASVNLVAGRPYSALVHSSQGSSDPYNPGSSGAQFIGQISATFLPDGAPRFRFLTGLTGIPEGTSVAFTIAAFDPDGEAFFYQFDCDNGLAPLTGSETGTFSRNCSYSQDGGYRLRIVIYDRAGMSNLESINIRVVNADPVVSFGALTPPIISPGDRVAVQLQADDAGDDPLSYTINCGNGAVDSGSGFSSIDRSVSCRFDTVGEYSITASVSDDDTTVNAVPINVTVRDLFISSFTRSNAGEITRSADLHLVAGDANGNAVNYEIDCDTTNDASQIFADTAADGIVDVSVSCDYEVAGTYPVRARVTNGEGDIEQSLDVTIMPIGINMVINPSAFDPPIHITYYTPVEISFVAVGDVPMEYVVTGCPGILTTDRFPIVAGAASFICPGFGTVGSYAVNVTIFGAGAAVTGSTTVNIEAPNAEDLENWEK